MRHQEVAEKFFSKVLKFPLFFRFGGDCILKKMLTCPLSAILLWVRIWVELFCGKSQKISPNFSKFIIQEKVLKSYDFRTFYGCGGRTRTYDLRVMSPTSFQLLYSAIFGCAPQCSNILARDSIFVKHFFENFKSFFLGVLWVPILWNCGILGAEKSFDGGRQHEVF